MPRAQVRDGDRSRQAGGVSATSSAMLPIMSGKAQSKSSQVEATIT